jgi:transcriptional regulator of acetoin/glycerol metabolism
LSYSWPGNIRELEHAIEHAFVLSKGPTITLHDLPDEVIEVNKRRGRSVWKAGHGTLAEIEGQMLTAALERNHWNRSDTCTELGISRTTLWRKMRTLGLLDH